MSEKAIELLYVTNGHATFETKGLYRVVYHGKVRRDIYHSKELLTADEAIATAECYNAPAHTDYPFSEKRKWLAEAVSYEQWEEREQRCQDEQHQREMIAIEVKHQRRLRKKETRKLRKRVKRLKAKAG